MPTAKKAATIDQLTEKLGRINAAALIEYRGMSVAEIGSLRTDLRKSNVELQVTKNTLLRAAAHRNNMMDLDDEFNGPNAVAFIYGDESTGTKALNDFFKTSRVATLKSGILKGGRKVSAADFAKLADLPNRETLLAQIAGLLESPLSQLAALFNAPAQQFAYAIAQFEDKGGAAGAGVGAAAPVEAVPATPDEAPASTVDDVETTSEPVASNATEAPTTDAAAAAGETVASDVTAAPESEGGAMATAEVQPTETPTGQEVAADPTTAPESEGSADAQP